MGFDHGAFFVSAADPAEVAACQTRFAAHGVRVVHLTDFNQASAIFAGAGFPAIADTNRIELWRYSYLIERKMIADLRSMRAANLTRVGLQQSIEYFRLVNDGVFFAGSPQASVAALYSAYQQHPRLSLGLAREIAGQPFDADNPDPNNPHIREAMYSGLHPEIQTSFYLEHRARLAILRAAIDFIRVSPATVAARLMPLGLPQTFSDGVVWLSLQPSFERYAVLWQVFLWAFGGFILQDRLVSEHRLLSDHTGIPVTDVPTALRAFDELFPVGDWFALPGPTQARVVKMVPMSFRGLGVHTRLWFAGIGNLADFGCTDHTHTDLARWSRVAYDYITT